MDGDGLRGRLLVAAPRLSDPNFNRTVVLLLEHGPGGALGLVLNRPSHSPASEILEVLGPLASEPGLVHIGGPVSPSSAICLARVADGAPCAAVRPLFSSLAAVDLDGDLTLLAAAVSDLRLFAGYAGWIDGQLEDEIGRGDWFVVDSDDADPFTSSPEGQWTQVLRRQKSRLAMLASYPVDLSTN